MRLGLGVGAILAAVLLAACGSSAPTGDDFIEIPDLGSTRIDVPRPTSDDVACGMAFPAGESVAERAAALRRIGFFTELADLSDADLGVVLEQSIAEEWGDSLDPDDSLHELFVAERDLSRAWWRDLEADVFDGNGVYAAVLREWAAISAGTFEPTAIEETWESETGPARVSFELDGDRHVLEPEYLEDWIDPRIVTRVNELIAPSGRRFTFVTAFDQTAFVLALTADERTALEDRGWCFE